MVMDRLVLIVLYVLQFSPSSSTLIPMPRSSCRLLSSHLRFLRLAVAHSINKLTRPKVLGSIATDFSSAVFCAVITHDGSTKNGFTECQDDTVNTDGKGSYKGSKKGKGEEEPSGRETLDSLDF